MLKCYKSTLKNRPILAVIDEGDLILFISNDEIVRDYTPAVIAEIFRSITEEIVLDLPEGMILQGHIGTWYAYAEVIVNGQKCFKVEHEEYGDSANHYIVLQKPVDGKYIPLGEHDEVLY